MGGTGYNAAAKAAEDVSGFDALLLEARIGIIVGIVAFVLLASVAVWYLKRRHATSRRNSSTIWSQEAQRRSSRQSRCRQRISGSPDLVPGRGRSPGVGRRWGWRGMADTVGPGAIMRKASIEFRREIGKSQLCQGYVLRPMNREYQVRGKGGNANA